MRRMIAQSSPGPAGEADADAPVRRPWEDRLLDGGREPDPRFTLANERTFLAWIRTSLALLAGGVAVEAFTGEMFPPTVRLTLSALLLVVGALLALGAGVRWLRVERAMRNARPLPLPLIVPVLAGAVVVGTVVLLAATIARMG
ncbi:YidH family protein [Micrococcus flavus]